MSWIFYIIIGIAVIFILLVIGGNREYQKQENENKLRLKKMEENAPKNVSKHISVRSFIDERSGTIVLRANNFSTTGREWFVTQQNITVKESLESISTGVYSLSEIQSIKLDGNNLSFTILENRTHFVAGAVFEDRAEVIEKAIITFKSDDLAIAQAIHDRVLNSKK